MNSELQDKQKNQDDVVVDMPEIEAREETKDEEAPPSAVPPQEPPRTNFEFERRESVVEDGEVVAIEKFKWMQRLLCLITFLLVVQTLRILGMSRNNGRDHQSYLANNRMRKGFKVANEVLANGFRLVKTEDLSPGNMWPFMVGSKIGDDKIYNTFPPPFWTNTSASEEFTWGSLTVNFRTHYGKFVAAEEDGTASADRQLSRASEKFTPMKYSANVMSFKASHGKFLVCEPDGQVKADREFMRTWEAFHVYKSSACPNRNLGSICIAIKSAEHDKWLRATEDGELLCDVGGDSVPKDAVFYGWTESDLSFKLDNIKYNVSSAKIDNY